MDFFNNLSPSSQLIVSIIGVSILFLLILANNKRNTKIQRVRRKRNFGEKLTKKNEATNNK